MWPTHAPLGRESSNALLAVRFGVGRSLGRSASAVTGVRCAGKIVPVEVTVRLLKKAMDESGKTKFLIDGFPRNMNNVDVRPNSDSYYKSTGNNMASG